ncbi:MAG TPA: hypothetical protein EYQ21_03595 [Flavobacteriales bacterium]|nr:hypothetical protein [Flavobacteriales bacterium]
MNSDMREKYIEGRQSGMRPTDAARFADYSNPKRDSSRLETKDEVVIAAVKIIQADTRKRHLYTRDQAVLDLKEGIDIAKKNKEPQSIARCVNELNKMHGFLAPEKKEIEIDVSHQQYKNRLEQMSDEELLTKIGGEKGLIEDVEFEEVIDGTSNE